MSSHNQVGTWVRRGSLAAGIAFTATAEYELARRLGAKPPIAVMLPVALDCYVIAALRWFRAFDIALSLALMGAAQVAAHALEAGVLDVTLGLVTVVSLLVPVAIWRTHALARQTPRDAQDTEDAQDATASPTVPSVPEVATEVPRGPLSEAAVTLERAEQQDATRTPELPPGTRQDAQDATASTPVPSVPDSTMAELPQPAEQPTVTLERDTQQDAEDTDDGPPPEAPLMTSAQVADKYGITASTARNWVALGRIPVHTKDARGRNLFHPDELPDFHVGVRS